MTRVVLDTNAYAALFRGDTSVLDALGRAETVYLSVFVLGELYAGFRAGRYWKQNVKDLEAFVDRPTVRKLHTTEETPDIFGRLKHELKAAGTPIPINDVWIASHTLEVGAVLLTFDGHFRQVPGLRLWDPS